MKYNPRLKNDLERFKEYVILVEGKKDVATLKYHCFKKVYAIHKTGVKLRERIEEISKLVEKKKRFASSPILTNKGKNFICM